MENKNSQRGAFATPSQEGLTKREYFAGLALQGILSNPKQIDTTEFKWVAEHALGYADELLEQLEKQP